MNPSPATAVVHAWDNEQLGVIGAPAEARLLVEAGPGTGKTAVACARVANLVNEQDVSPANVLLISFTRTAVQELRQRIAAYIGSEARAAGVRISTLDSEAWRLHQGFGEEDRRVLGDYDAGIEAVRGVLRSGSIEVVQYLRRFRHVIVDEAQDLMGIRARLVLELIAALDPDCGVTVFADPAQAIYGFTADDQAAAAASECFLELLNAAGGTRFDRRTLETLHRTGSQQLRRVFQGSRALLGRNGAAGYAALRASLTAQAPGAEPAVEAIRERSDHLLLYRYRRDVLRLSHELCSEGVPHRLRLSRVPVCVPPWIGWLLSACPRLALDRASFLALWADRQMPQRFPGLDATNSLNLLLRLAKRPDGQLDLHQLRRVLARSRPPVEACQPECGTAGPVLGTIHASKGREAPHVLLGLPDNDPEDNHDEEMRVLYVGATRARESLRTHPAPRLYGGSLPGSGRLWRQLIRDGPNDHRRRAQVEFGLEGDIDLFAGVRRDFGLMTEAQQAQQYLADAAGRLEPAVAECRKDWDWAYRLRPDNDEQTSLWFGQFSRQLADDLWEVAKVLGSKFGRTYTPLRVPYLYLFGVRTVAVAPDSPTCGLLHEPFASSGFLLAPVIRSYTVLYFRDGGRR
jgi:hypothetical protein